VRLERLIRLCIRGILSRLQLIRAQLEQSPRDARLWTLEGIAFSGAGSDKQAMVAYNRALSISPDFLAALEGAAGLEFKAESDRAIPLLNRISKLRPAEPTSHAMLGVLAYRKHDCATAVGHFRQARLVLPSQPIALERFGACLVEQQQAEEALPVFEQLLAMRPGDAHTRYNLAVVQSTAKRSKDAIETLQPLLEQKEPDTDALDLASAAYEETGDTPRAVALLRQAIVASPRTAKYYVDFAALSYKHESYQVGVDMVNAGVKVLPTAASLYVARGILYIQMGNFQSGEADFETANKLDPRQASAAVAQGLAQLQQSNLDQALATVGEQLKSHPKDSFLHLFEGGNPDAEGRGCGVAGV
jgi:tetratricopeptide (TPR) repeat protein